MSETNNNQGTVVRTSRGLSVKGTRITLYQIMDYIKAGISPSVIRDHFRLTVKQTLDILKYIETHQEEVESEYQQVLAYADEIRQYWEKKNGEHFAEIISAHPEHPEPNKEYLYAKLNAAKSRLCMSC